MSSAREAKPGEILDAIEAELEETRRPLRVELRAVQALANGVTRLSVEASRPLDEGLEGARAWWPRPGSRGGTAEVLSVQAEREQIDLWQLSTALPAVGEALFLYPPRYLEALQRAWRDPRWSEAALARSRRLDRPAPFGLRADGFARLRTAQRRAFGLLDERDAFLHGPPGTGKTTTVGALLASLLVQRPDARVLLLSTTNGAVDEALLSVDRGLAHLGAEATRPLCKRVGVRFEGTRYREVPHLLPPVDHALLRRRAELERARPPREDAVATARWTEAMEEVRRGLRRHLLGVARAARLLAMTTTHAAFVLEALRELDPFDLLVVDEASQVSQAHAMALSPLAERALYAGDPKQLGPVVQSPHPLAQRWLRSSMFRGVDEGPGTVFLDEQSRMAPEICALVSEVFYAGRLRVADDAQQSPRWHEARRLPATPPELCSALRVEEIALEAGGAPEREGAGSARRPGSARRLLAWVEQLAASGVEVERDVLILTPFRAQRALLQRLLHEGGHGGVQVSTVHRAQGRERRVVLYDPVDGASEFLQGDEARRLLNVALSRAQAQLLVIVSSRDLLHNDLLRQIRDVACQRHEQPVASLVEILHRAGFPAAFDGVVVSHRGRRLRLDASASDDQRLACVDLASGQPRRYDLVALRALPRSS